MQVLQGLTAQGEYCFPYPVDEDDYIKSSLLTDTTKTSEI